VRVPARRVRASRVALRSRAPVGAGAWRNRRAEAPCRFDEPAKAAGVRSRDAIFPPRRDNLGTILPRALWAATPLVFRAWPEPHALVVPRMPPRSDDPSVQCPRRSVGLFGATGEPEASRPPTAAPVRVDAIVMPADYKGFIILSAQKTIVIWCREF
jgi:hypothetical protein